MPPDNARVARKEPKAASGPALALARLGLTRDIDRVLHLPLRYEDETRLTSFEELADGRCDGQWAQVDGVVERSEAQQQGPRRGWLVTLRDGDGASGGRERLLLRFLHVHPAHRKTFVVGAWVRVRGELRGGFWGREMVHPAFRGIEPGAPLPTSLTPVYPSVAGLPQAYLRRVIGSALQRADLRETLPDAARELLLSSLPAARGWPPLADAVRGLHEPPPGEAEAWLQREHPARQRLAFDELLAQQLSQLHARRLRAEQRAPLLGSPAKAPTSLRARLLATLPFALTPAQERVAAEIAVDLARGEPMHRLLQGDVGAGKTVVAALAAAQAIDAGWQCALMAPTEILVAQHATKLAAWLEPLGVQTAWLSGSRQGRARERAREATASGAAQLVVGTQAMLEDGVQFARLGLVVIDEQHRFGVEQRLALRRKLQQVQAGQTDETPRSPPNLSPPNLSQPHLSRQHMQPHVLGMSATPIPRTLAMALFADLDVSTIDSLPPGRTPIVTRVFGESRRAEVIERLRHELAQGRQVYWVCPLVEAVETDEAGAAPGRTPGHEAASMGATSRAKADALDRLAMLSNAIDTHAELQGALPGTGIGLLHGRLPAREKAAVMQAFAQGALGVLVATTVIEVGVDVPNASVMVIEHAERFGLAQLHQLRGRVGRGAAASVCVLLYGQPLSAVARERLQVMAQTHDGFEIARRDLELRGPGEFLGARQSGAALLRFADIVADADQVEPTRALAEWLWREHPEAARRQIERFRGGESEYLNA
jgi:ATP-dependent DNA helicase RecG